ncbi:hypothetical protein [Sphingomonas sp. UYP23]
MIKFLWLKELHRLPPLPPGQTSPQRRYLTTNTNAAQRLRALIAERTTAQTSGAHPLPPESGRLVIGLTPVLGELGGAWVRRAGKAPQRICAPLISVSPRFDRGSP